MNITKCDICKKTIKPGAEKMHLERKGDIRKFAWFELCTVCSEPIIEMLKDKNLIKDEK
jgi:hypothetical protein